jgi:hypothetical protein
MAIGKARVEFNNFVFNRVKIPRFENDKTSLKTLKMECTSGVLIGLRLVVFPPGTYRPAPNTVNVTKKGTSKWI